MHVVITQTVIYAILQVRFIRYAVIHKIPVVTQIASQLLSNLQAINKSVRLANTVEQLHKVSNEMSTLWKKYRPNNEIRYQILNEARQTYSFCKCYFTIASASIIFYILPPLINVLMFEYPKERPTNYTYDYTMRVLVLEYPFEVNNAQINFLLFFQEAYLLVASVLFWVNSDTMFALLASHICLQFKILKSDIEAVISRENDENKFEKNLIIFVKRHQRLLRICNLLEKIFSSVILSMMLLSAFNLCVNIFEVRKTISKGQYADAAIHLIIFTSTFIQMLFYCMFAESLTEQTRSIADSIYNCKWTTKSYKFRFYFQLIIMRSQKPFYCTAYGFFLLATLNFHPLSAPLFLII